MQIDHLPELTLLHRPNGEMAAVYEQIHALGGPGIFKSPDGNGLIVTSYAALHTLRKSPNLEALKRKLRTGGSGEIGVQAQLAEFTPFFVNNPLHTPLAAATYQPFVPARRAAIEDRFTACVIDGLQAMRTQESCDLVEAFARTVTCAFWMSEIRAPKSMNQAFRDWSNAITPMLAFQCSEQQVLAANQAAQEMWDYLRKLALTAGKDSLLTRYTSYLEQLPDGHQNGADLVAAITFDGIDSAAGAIANVLYVVLSDDELQATLRKNPDQIDNALREAMRLESPLPGLHRGTTAPVRYAGIDIPEGINLFMAWGCGNRDPKAYDEPNVFKFERKNRTILSFGGGRRFCKGRTLAMVQCTVALQLLLEHSEWIEMTRIPTWSPPGMLRTVDALECRIRYIESKEALHDNT